MQEKVKQLEDKSNKITFITDFEGEEFCVVKIPPALGLKPKIVKIVDYEELEKELRALYAEKEQENVDTRNAEQLLKDLVAEVQGGEFQTYVDSYFQIVGNEWQLMQGLLFMRQEDDVFRKVAHYAYYSNEAELQFVSGETLLGQVVKEGKPLYIDHVESESIIVASGTGACMPCSVYMIPFAQQGKICNGIFELAFVKPLDEKERDLLTRFTERISIEIEKKA